MRIGIVPILSGLSGGIYQYSLTMLRALDELKSDECQDEFVVLAPESNICCPTVVSLNSRGWAAMSLSPLSRFQQIVHALRPIVGEGPHRQAWRWLRRKVERAPQRPEPLPDPEVVHPRPDLARWWREQRIDLVLYPAPMTLSFEVGIPYIVAIHDLQHRLQPEFPEVSMCGEWEEREYLFRNCARDATLILADSEVGKEDVLYFYSPYGVTPDRVKVLPFLHACYLSTDVPTTEQRRVREKYRLPERYLFYPAQFWPHKNHARIIQALEHLQRVHGLEIPAVFCGSYTSEIREQQFRLVMNMAQHGGVANQIHYLGYVPDGDMAALYASATALVMPTFFGPTNIPVLEAWAFGCPVLTSDIRGIREQVGDAAVLADPRSVAAISEGIYRLWTDEDLRHTLVDRGRQRLAAYTPDDYRRRLMEILEEAKARVRSEKPNSAMR